MKFFIDNIWLILLVLLSGGALAWPALSRSKFAVSTLQATQLLNKGKVQVVDVRTPEEFASRIEKDLQEWGAIVKSSNITVD